jgi:hypothetical protein
MRRMGTVCRMAPVQRPAPSLRGVGGTGALFQEPTCSAPSAARAASSRATGTRNGEQDT